MIIINRTPSCILERPFLDAEVGSQSEADSGLAAPAGGSLGGGGAQLGTGPAPLKPQKFQFCSCTQPLGRV